MEVFTAYKVTIHLSLNCFCDCLLYIRCANSLNYKYLFYLKDTATKRRFYRRSNRRFQAKADHFFSKWVELVGYDGVTNYIHMLGAGHVRYYLKKWRNLNRFQNQGWESYNKYVAAFWHHRTQKGGHGLNRNKIFPIGRWLLRCMLWKTGVAPAYFKEKERTGQLNNSIDCDPELSDNINDDLSM
jgi:hypothetical protein